MLPRHKDHIVTQITVTDVTSRYASNTSYSLIDLLVCLFILLSDYPRGWVYLRPTQKYYRAIFELMDWKKAERRCRDLGMYSRLVDINDHRENMAVKRFIASFEGNNYTL